jgi:hypothetical protein
MLRLLALVLAAALVGAPTEPNSVAFHATLSGAAEVPPTDAKAKGTLKASFYTSSFNLEYEIRFDGLSGPPTMIHFQGPAGSDTISDIEVSLGENAPSPLRGEVRLADKQVNALMAGNWYVNIRTAANPEGEIRGRLTQ